MSHLSISMPQNPMIVMQVVSTSVEINTFPVFQWFSCRVLVARVMCPARRCELRGNLHNLKEVYSFGALKVFGVLHSLKENTCAKGSAHCFVLTIHINLTCERFFSLHFYSGSFCQCLSCLVYSHHLASLPQAKNSLTTLCLQIIGPMDWSCDSWVT